MIGNVEIAGTDCLLEFNALLAKAQYEDPEEVTVTDEVPYSAAEYDFTDLYGTRILKRRDVTYRFKFVNPNRVINEDDLARFKAFLYSLTDDVEIHEDDMPGYHWVGKRGKITNVKDTVGYTLGARMVEVVFRCKPYRTSNLGDAFSADEKYFPDLDNSGSVTASDAATILQAAARIAAGKGSGLTPEQELRADCDRNGVINASDAQLVFNFAAKCGVGKYENTPKGWAQFLNDAFGRHAEVI